MIFLKKNPKNQNFIFVTDFFEKVFQKKISIEKLANGLNNTLQPSIAVWRGGKSPSYVLFVILELSGVWVVFRMNLGDLGDF